MKFSTLSFMTLVSSAALMATSTASALSIATCIIKLDSWELGSGYLAVNGAWHTLAGGESTASKALGSGLDKLGGLGSGKLEEYTDKVQGYIDAHPRSAAALQAAAAIAAFHQVRYTKDLIKAAKFEVKHPNRTFSFRPWVQRGVSGLAKLEPMVQDVLMADDAKINLTREDMAEAVVAFNSASKSCISSAISQKKFVRAIANQVEILKGVTPKGKIEDTDEDKGSDKINPNAADDSDKE